MFKEKTMRQSVLDGLKLAPQKKLFGEFWYTGELCIFFGDSNLGKSILAYQIGNNIAKGKGEEYFSVSARAQKILYFDFELTEQQLTSRYSEKVSDHKYRNPFKFNANFIRCESDKSALPPPGITHEDYIIKSIEQTVKKRRARVIIIDNITALITSSTGKSAPLLMKKLDMLKDKHKISILAIAHTPKRKLTNPLTENDLAGSKVLFNLSDSCFAIGQSTTGKNMRYIKQIKGRTGEKNYGAENVVVCEMIKPKNYVYFHPVGCSPEVNHIESVSKRTKASRNVEIMDLKEQGLSNVAIANMFGISEGAVRKILRKAEE